MTAKTTFKAMLKQIRWRSRRIEAASRWGPRNLGRTPRVFGNAMPKSGSHLLTQVLRGLTQLGPFVDPGFPPVNRDEANQPLQEEKIFNGIYRMLSGDIRYGYIHAKEPYISLLNQPEQATIFIYRDPRDMLVSHIFYATDLYQDHGMHPYYAQLDNMDARLNAAIEGVSTPEYYLSNVRERYDSYLGWLSQPDIFCLRFEDLILERDVALARLLGYLAIRGFEPTVPPDQAVEILKARITPEKSGTFRKGQTGEWQEHFSDANKERFKEVAGDLLILLGYEDTNDW